MIRKRWIGGFKVVMDYIKKLKEKKKELIYQLIILVLFIICITVHLFNIEQIPFGVHVDEMGMGYDAWCLKNYGTDRYLSSYPVYLNNFGGGQSALYAYLCAFIFHFLDFSVFSIRLPGIIIFLAYVLTGVMVLKCDKEEGKLKALLFLFFATVLPVCVMLFRMGLDSNLMMPVSGIFLFCLIRAADSGKSKDYVLAGVLAGITLYTYVISYIVLLGFLIIIIPYLLLTKKIRPVQIIYFGIMLGIFAFPLIMVQLINLMDLKEIQFGFLTFTKLFKYRTNDIGLDHLSLESIKNCLKSVFWYDCFRYDSLPEFGTIYFISVPIVLIGIGKSIYVAIKKLIHRMFCVDMIFCIWFIIMLFSGCVMDSFTCRMNGIYVSILFFLMEGVRTLVSWIKKYIRYGILTSILAVYVILYISFLQFYFGGQYEEKYKPLDYFDYPLDEAMEYLETAGLWKDRITYIGHLSQTYIYYLGYTLLPPEKYHEENKLIKEDSLSRSAWTESFKNFVFYLPEKIDFYGNYIVNDVAEEKEGYGYRLRKAGFELQKLENYNIYTFELSSFNYVGDNYLLQWNAGVQGDNTILIQSASQVIEDREYVVLVGWAGNAEDDCSWDYFCVTDDKGNYYIADVVERQDVVESTGKEDLLQSGLLFVIPKEELEGKEKLWMVGIDSKNRKYMKEEIGLAEE